MKKYIVFLFSLILITNISFGQSGWFWINIGGECCKPKVQFIDEYNGYICGGNSYNIYCQKTVNGGLNWVTINILPLSPDANDMYFKDINSGWMVTNQGGIYKTTNAGLNWSKIQYLNNDIMKCVFFSDSLNGLIGETHYNPTNGYLVKTTNGGINWEIKLTNTFLGHFVFLNSDTGFANGSYYGSNVILKTTDGGENWSTYYLPSLPSNIFFVGNVGFVACSNGNILKSVDLGITWSLIASTNFVFFDMFFYDLNTGWGVGSNTLCKTTDSGLSWYNEANSQSNVRFNSVYFVNPNTGFVLDYGTFLLKTTTGGGQIVFSPTNNDLSPDRFNLFDNYPNPFNPVTKIKFDISKSSFAKIIIYDILGREVITLLDEELKPGTYSVDWDGSNYASGIYFYRLEANDFTETKKMVLMK